MSSKEREEYLKRVKENLHRAGFKCMRRSFIPLIALFLLYEEGSGLFGLLPEEIFWMVQKFFTLIFISGAAAYLFSLKIRITKG